MISKGRPQNRDGVDFDERYEGRDKPISLYPMKVEEAVKIMLNTPPLKTVQSRREQRMSTRVTNLSIQQAINSGKPFRKAGGKRWFKMGRTMNGAEKYDEYGWLYIDVGNGNWNYCGKKLSLIDILIDDWEVCDDDSGSDQERETI